MAETLDALKVRIHELEKEVERWKSQVKSVRYGLNWMDVPEAFDKDSEDKIPILEEVSEKAVDAKGPLAGRPPHVIIEGDNYHALTCLNYTHRGKIDVIYIDPPYNTGSDGFTYKDARFLTEFPDGRPIPKDYPLRHSSWLSFMNKRLKLAKSLLKDDGVIFISINEEEYAQLKLLCDSIFLESNYITSFTIKVRHEDRILKGDKPIHEVTEFLLMYQKSPSFNIQKRSVDNSSPKDYKYKIKELIDNPEIINCGGKDVSVFRPGEYEIIECGESFENLKKINIRGSIKAGNSSGRFHMAYLESRRNDFNVLYKVPGIGDDGLGYRYFISRKDAKQANGSYFQGSPLNRPDVKEIPYPNFLDFEAEFNDVGNEGGVPFGGGKKPIAFIQHLLKICSNKSNLKILDFFAGSGSTGHSIIDLNVEKDASHQFILVQSPDLTYEIKDGKKIPKKGAVEVFLAGFERIVDVTRQRCKNVIQGYTNAKGESVEGLGGSLKYYKTGFVGKHQSKNANDADKVELAEKAGCLIALAENTLDTIKVPEAAKGFWQIYSDNAEKKKRYTCIYHNGDYGKVSDFVAKIDELRATDKKSKFTVYVFSWNSPDFFENEFDDLKNIEIKAIPKPILEIYKALNG